MLDVPGCCPGTMISLGATVTDSVSLQWGQGQEVSLLELPPVDARVISTAHSLAVSGQRETTEPTAWVGSVAL